MPESTPPATEDVPPIAIGLHHIGMTVTDLDDSIAFWCSFLDCEPPERRLVSSPYIGEIIGYPGAAIEVCTLRPPETPVSLELVKYIEEEKEPYGPDTAHPGNTHVCFQVADVSLAWRKAVAAGASPVSDGPVRIPSGPAEGTLIAYLRNPDGVTLELLQSPTSAD